MRPTSVRGSSLWDIARSHSARRLHEYILQVQLDTFHWPAFNPNLNHIEYVWDMLKKALRQLKPLQMTLKNLRQACLIYRPQSLRIAYGTSYPAWEDGANPSRDGHALYWGTINSSYEQNMYLQVHARFWPFTHVCIHSFCRAVRIFLCAHMCVYCLLRCMNHIKYIVVYTIYVFITLCTFSQWCDNFVG